MRRPLPFLLLLLPLCALAQQTHIGKVVRIADGDTLSILVDEQTLRIRLAEIDTPERRQPFGTKAKQALADLTFNKSVRVVEVDVDRYGRIVGRVYVNGLTVNAELVKQGYAWVYRKYAKSRELYRLEDEARNAKRGL
jgi:endonuclease YncB( thermonuclease family)